MVSFASVSGDLLVGESAEDDVRVEDKNSLYRSAVFRSDRISIVFKEGMSGYFSVGEDSFETVDGETFYYPYQNETTVKNAIGVNYDEMNLLEDNVKLEVANVEDTVFVRSQDEVTAYGGTYIVVDDSIYEIVNSMLFEPQESSDDDELLGLTSCDTPVRVRNVETGYSTPVEHERIVEMVDRRDYNGALKVNGNAVFDF